MNQSNRHVMLRTFRRYVWATRPALRSCNEQPDQNYYHIGTFVDPKSQKLPYLEEILQKKMGQTCVTRYSGNGNGSSVTRYVALVHATTVLVVGLW